MTSRQKITAILATLSLSSLFFAMREEDDGSQKAALIAQETVAGTITGVPVGEVNAHASATSDMQYIGTFTQAREEFMNESFNQSNNIASAEKSKSDIENRIIEKVKNQ